MACPIIAYTGLSQEPAADTTAQALFVFLDCNGPNCDFDFLDCNGPNCDFDHFRREITWINWVRDRADSDLHLLRQLAGAAESVSYVSDPDDTDSEVRDGLTQMIALGLVQFVRSTPLAPRLRVVYDEPDVAVVEREENDPWNLWVFRVGAEASLDGESEERAYSLEGGASADRVSEDLKISFQLDGEYDREEFYELEEGETFVNVSEEYSARMTGGRRFH
jgi:hypothetical protein